MVMYENDVEPVELARAMQAQALTNYEIIRRDYKAYRMRHERSKRRVLVWGEYAEKSE